MKFEVDARKAATLPFVCTWALLIVLGAVSLASSFLKLGSWDPVIEFFIAAIQVSLVFLLFMRLKGPPTLKWILAGVGFLWLTFLFGLSMTDYSNRRGWPAQTPGEPTMPAQRDGLG